MEHEPTATGGRTPAVMTPAELVESAGHQTAGIVRRQAFGGDDRWIGHVRTEPGDWSGWHHHADTDTYFYLVRGGLEFEYGADGSVVRLEAGDFGFMPARVVHHERTPEGEAGEIVLVRIGRGPTVVNVDGPATGE